MPNAERCGNTFQIRLTPEDDAILERAVVRRRAEDPAGTFTKSSILRGLIRTLEPAKKKTKTAKR